MGETGFTVNLSNELFVEGFTVVHSTTRRVVEINEETGVKVSKFNFVQFRKTFL